MLYDVIHRSDIYSMQPLFVYTVVPAGTVVVSVVRTIVLRGRDGIQGGQDATWG